MTPLTLLATAVFAATLPLIPGRAQVELMNRIERQLFLPAGAKPLSSYTRFYYDAGPDVVAGTFVRGQEGRRWVNSPLDAPGIKDGGCDIVNDRFDRPSNRITAVYCNGEA